MKYVLLEVYQIGIKKESTLYLFVPNKRNTTWLKCIATTWKPNLGGHKNPAYTYVSEQQNPFIYMSPLQKTYQYGMYHYTRYESDEELQESEAYADLFIVALEQSGKESKLHR
jgi:hypothetical protein